MKKFITIFFCLTTITSLSCVASSLTNQATQASKATRPAVNIELVCMKNTNSTQAATKTDEPIIKQIVLTPEFLASLASSDPKSTQDYDSDSSSTRARIGRQDHRFKPRAVPPSVWLLTPPENEFKEHRCYLHYLDIALKNPK